MSQILAPLWSAHLTCSRTEDTPCYVMSPHEPLEPQWRVEQNLSTAVETETSAMRRSNSALSEFVEPEKCLLSHLSFCMGNFLSSILQMFHFSISSTIHFLSFFVLFNLCFKISFNIEDE